MVQRLPAGPRVATTGAICSGAYSRLGTGHVGPGAAPQTTVINLWRIERKGAPLGWIVKTSGNLYWYEDPASSYYEQITGLNAAELRGPGIGIIGCFRGDLAR